MLSVELDLHKRYSQVEVLDDAGVRRASARLRNELEQVAGFFRSLGEPPSGFGGWVELGIDVRLARGDRKRRGRTAGASVRSSADRGGARKDRSACIPTLRRRLQYHNHHRQPQPSAADPQPSERTTSLEPTT